MRKSAFLPIAVFVAILSVFFFKQSDFQSEMSSNDTNQRVLLPSDIVPLKYHLRMRPDQETFKFTGSVDIDLKVLKETNEITFHSNALDISKDSLSVTVGDRQFTPKDLTYNTELQTATVHLNEALPVGENVKLGIGIFTGVLNDQLVGFYRSKYVYNGQDHWLFTTQMEPTDARMAFPCWDEPAKKAVFSITLEVPADKIAISNTHIVEQKASDDSKYKIITYADTPLMSTYLVSFVIGDLDFVEGITKEGINMKVYTPLGKKEQGRFALDVGLKTLSYFSEYFDIGYPLKKLDMVAIPDFSAGAMENWGLVTYRETALLVDENSGVSTRQRVAYVVAHELTHQWFGNLVTMEWWKELWLNEGFATFVGNQAVDHLFPEWDIWTDFNSKYFSAALDLDSLLSTHPIEVEVYSSSEINEIFDRISYCKGASLNRMVWHYLGEKAFQEGLRVYLKRHSYANARTVDLWSALSEVSKRDVTSFMHLWTTVGGYPVITITSTSSPTKFVVKQKRFLSSGATAPEKTIWWISLGITSSKANGKVHYVDIKEETQEIELPADLFENSAWIKANALQSTFGRIQYDEALLSNLAKAIESKAIPAIDRMGVQNDAFALAQAGLLRTSQALSVAGHYANETEYTVLSDLLGQLNAVMTVWRGEKSHALLKKYIRRLVKPTFNRLGWEKKQGESDLDTLLRAVVISVMGHVDDDEVIQEARKRFEQYRAGNTAAVPADVRYAVFRMAITSGGRADWEAVRKIYRDTDMSEERIRALRALGSARSEDLLRETLDFSISDEVRAQDTFYGTAAVSGSSILGCNVSWEYLKQNWDKFAKKFEGGSSGFLFSKIVGSATSGFTSEEKATEIEHFFKENPAPFADRTLKQSLETIRLNAKWINRDLNDVQDFLNAQSL